ncbi:Hypothetical protein NTJ_06911 [Nesidiocoris tenuis]|uniref:Centriolar and ciliogenesis-associated protein HYLS1 C-terminal domain-containing protein n=1 Tax=Nesidiocoris tenuis TaxID=355587 RepID=A0ABN7AUH4_9HEMI|nr:Hypothetical protein NTJ_06911 [Nesidiocoris tenuis]
MSEPIDLYPQEVLEHLKSLGYHHITKDQLKQFIKDLKKLIKHDLRKAQAQQENQFISDDIDGSHHTKGNERPARKILGERNQAGSQSKSVSVQTLETDEDVCAGSSREALPESRLGTSSAKSSTCCAGRCCQTAAPKKSSANKENPPLKPVSSFIRVAPSVVKDGKTDPVTLYHYYQSLWARQNRPGENPHSDVRWRIRHKMMAPAIVRSNPDRRRENPPWVE